MNGKKYIASQCNNMYIFPGNQSGDSGCLKYLMYSLGMGLGSVLAKATTVTDGMIYAASQVGLRAYCGRYD